MAKLKAEIELISIILKTSFTANGTTTSLFSFRQQMFMV